MPLQADRCLRRTPGLCGKDIRATAFRSGSGPAAIWDWRQPARMITGLLPAPAEKKSAILHAFCHSFTGEDEVGGRSFVGRPTSPNHRTYRSVYGGTQIYDMTD